MTFTRRAGACLVLLIAGVGAPATANVSRSEPARAKTAPNTVARALDVDAAQALVDRVAAVDQWEARASRHAVLPITTTTTTTATPPPVFEWPAPGPITGPFGERRGR